MRRAPLPHLCALLAGVAASLAVGCGGRSHLIPANQASSLKDELAAVQDAVDGGNCTAAVAALNRATATANGLHRRVDRRLRRRIDDGIRKLQQTVPQDCQQQQQTTPTTPTTTTETVTTVTTPTVTTTTETVPPETTTATVPTTPTTTPTTPTTTPTTPPTTTTTAPGTSTSTGGTAAEGATG